jgi:hemoglobin-like flavoprotein
MKRENGTAMSLNLTPRQKNLIRRSFGIVAGQSEMVGQLFYARLFALDASLRRLFQHDMNEQVNKLMGMIALCVNCLDDEKLFDTTVAELGARHVGYGVQDAHYALVGESLIWALSEGLGAAFTPDVKTAWSTLYDYMAQIAIRGAQASAPPDKTP